VGVVRAISAFHPTSPFPDRAGKVSLGASPTDADAVAKVSGAPIVLKKSVFDGLARAAVVGSDGAR
jgi:hypothetical protein